jgi:glutathione S-transferase
MKLYYAPGACSIGIHVLLEEIGKPYELGKLDFAAGEQHGPEFKRVNPKGKVPTLVRDDGSVLTEFPAVALWLAWTNPEKKLLPDDVEGRTRAIEAVDYVVATLHMQGFGRMLRPAMFAPSEGDHERVRARGREIFAGGLQVMDGALAGKDYAVGSFSIADAALFYVEFWAVRRLQLPLPANLAAHFERLTSRPTVQRVLEAEGFGG